MYLQLARLVDQFTGLLKNPVILPHSTRKVSIDRLAQQQGLWRRSDLDYFSEHLFSDYISGFTLIDASRMRLQQCTLHFDPQIGKFPYSDPLGVISSKPHLAS